MMELRVDRMARKPPMKRTRMKPCASITIAVRFPQSRKAGTTSDTHRSLPRQSVDEARDDLSERLGPDPRPAHKVGVPVHAVLPALASRFGVRSPLLGRVAPVGVILRRAVDDLLPYFWCCNAVSNGAGGEKTGRLTGRVARHLVADVAGESKNKDPAKVQDQQGDRSAKEEFEIAVGTTECRAEEEGSSRSQYKGSIEGPRLLDESTVSPTSRRARHDLSVSGSPRSFGLAPSQEK